MLTTRNRDKTSLEIKMVDTHTPITGSQSSHPILHQEIYGLNTILIS